MLHPFVTLANVADVAYDQGSAELAFLGEVVRGLAVLRGEAERQAAGRHTKDDLSIPLGLSAWIVRAAMDLPDAYDALLRLRRAVVEAAGLDRLREPVPLRVADPRAALRSLGAYLYDLVGRAARHAGVSPVEVAERTLELVEI